LREKINGFLVFFLVKRSLCSFKEILAGPSAIICIFRRNRRRLGWHAWAWTPNEFDVLPYIVRVLATWSSSSDGHWDASHLTVFNFDHDVILTIEDVYEAIAAVVAKLLSANNLTTLSVENDIKCKRLPIRDLRLVDFYITH
jgi:hypothetical protein